MVNLVGTEFGFLTVQGPHLCVLDPWEVEIGALCVEEAPQLIGIEYKAHSYKTQNNQDFSPF